jgi:hypothetical protein
MILPKMEGALLLGEDKAKPVCTPPRTLQAAWNARQNQLYNGFFERCFTNISIADEEHSISSVCYSAHSCCPNSLPIEHFH